MSQSATPTARYSAQREICADPTEDRYVDLVIAIFKRAKSDLHHPGYRQSAQQWLHSRHAAWYAGLLGVTIDTADPTEPRHV